jgi:hypothetical protein
MFEEGGRLIFERLKKFLRKYEKYMYRNMKSQSRGIMTTWCFNEGKYRSICGQC